MKLTIVCENYWPEYASTGQLITELAEVLAPDSDVEVLTAQPRYNAAYASRPRLEERNGVQISRLRTTGFSKETRLGRVANWLSFLLSVTVAIATRWRRRTYLFVTNPQAHRPALTISTPGKRKACLVDKIDGGRPVGFATKLPDTLRRPSQVSAQCHPAQCRPSLDSVLFP